jgi:hypothetical protein
VAVDYRLAFDTITRILHAHTGRSSVPKIAEAVWDTFVQRWRSDHLTEVQARMWRSDNDRDVRELLEALASVDAVDLDGDTVELTGTGRTDLARRRGEPLPGAEVWRLRIELLEVANPQVWRKIDVTPAMTLDRLHRVIQSAMGWQDCQLHSFTADDGVDYGPVDLLEDLPLRDEQTTAVADILAPNREVRYTYDFGDDWHHRLTLELTTIAQEGRSYPYCFDGAGVCPAEDSGGPYGWAGLKAAVADQNDDEHTDYLTWLGLTNPSQFDLNAFDLDAANKRLRAIT